MTFKGHAKGQSYIYLGHSEGEFFAIVMSFDLVCEFFNLICIEL